MLFQDPKKNTRLFVGIIMALTVIGLIAEALFFKQFEQPPLFADHGYGDPPANDDVPTT